MKSLQKEDGSYVHPQQELETDVLDFYKDLMGKDTEEIDGIDTSAMREDIQLNAEQI